MPTTSNDAKLNSQLHQLPLMKHHPISREQLVESLINPQTPEEFSFALTNPLSPIFKKMANLQNQRVEILDIIAHIFDKRSMIEFKEKIKVKNEILRQIEAGVNLAKERNIRLDIQLDRIASVKVHVPKYDKPTLKDTEVKYKSQLVSLKVDLMKLEKKIEEQKVKAAENSTQYIDTLNKTAEVAVKKKLELKIKIPTGGVKVMFADDIKKSLQETIAKPPTPTEISSMLNKSYDSAGEVSKQGKEQKRSAIDFLPPPPPPPPVKPTAKMCAGQAMINLQMKFIMDLAQKAAEEVGEHSKDNAKPDIDHKCLLSILRDNKKALKTIFDPSNMPGLEKIFSDAMELEQSSRETLLECQAVQKMKEATEDVLEKINEVKVQMEDTLRPHFRG